MMTYNTLSTQPRPFLAMTGLTPAEFRDLLPAFETAYDHAYPLIEPPLVSPAKLLAGAGRHSRPLQRLPTNCCSCWSN